MKISIFAIKSKKNSWGESPIYVRLATNGQRFNFSTGVFVYPNEWSNKTKKVTKRSEAKEFNALIASKVNQVRLSYDTIVTQKKEVTKDNLVHYLNQDEKKEITFAELIQLYRNNVSLSTKTTIATKKANLSKIKMIKKVLSDLGYLNEPLSIFHPKKTYRFFEKLEEINKFKSLSPATLNKYNQHLTRLFDFGIREELINTSNPVLMVNAPPPPKKELNYLTKAEIEILEKSKFRSLPLNKVKDNFLLQCYTGLSYIDLMQLNKSNINTGLNGVHYISIERQKTKVQSNAPIDDRAINILAKYDYTTPQITNQKYNYYLKEIAEIVGINKRVTSHTGRRTAGFNFLNNGISIESVSAILGHANIKTTQNMYARITPDRICEEFKKSFAT